MPAKMKPSYNEWIEDRWFTRLEPDPFQEWLGKDGVKWLQDKKPAWRTPTRH